MTGRSLLTSVPLEMPVPKPTFLKLPDEKRARVLDAAIDEFASVPFEAASVNRIVRGAGIAKGSFYQYFEDMVDLYRYLVLVELGNRKTAFVLAHPPPEGLGLFGQLAHTAVTGIRWAMTEPRVSAAARHLWYPAPPGSALRAFQDEVRTLQHGGLRMMLQGGQAAGAVRQDLDLDMAAAMMLVVLRHGLDALLMQRCGVDPMTLCSEPERAEHVTEEVLEEVVAALIDQLQHGLGTGSSTGDLDMARLVQHVQGAREP